MLHEFVDRRPSQKLLFFNAQIHKKQTPTTTHLAFSVVHQDHGCHRCRCDSIVFAEPELLARASASIPVSGLPLSVEVRREGLERGEGGELIEVHGMWHWDCRHFF